MPKFTHSSWHLSALVANVFCPPRELNSTGEGWYIDDVLLIFPFVVTRWGKDEKQTAVHLWVEHTCAAVFVLLRPFVQLVDSFNGTPRYIAKIVNGEKPR